MHVIIYEKKEGCTKPDKYFKRIEFRGNIRVVRLCYLPENACVFETRDQAWEKCAHLPKLPNRKPPVAIRVLPEVIYSVYGETDERIVL